MRPGRGGTPQPNWCGATKTKTKINKFNNSDGNITASVPAGSYVHATAAAASSCNKNKNKNKNKAKFDNNGGNVTASAPADSYTCLSAAAASAYAEAAAATARG
jgi:hypothetical protein